MCEQGLCHAFDKMACPLLMKLDLTGIADAGCDAFDQQ
jgi:hypothetical protein